MGHPQLCSFDVAERKVASPPVIGYVVMPEHIHLLIGECDHATPTHHDAGAQATLCTARARRSKTVQELATRFSLAGSPGFQTCVAASVL